MLWRKIIMAFKYKTEPFDHQKKALEKSAFKKNFAYFMEMGCVDGETEFLSNRGWIKFKDFNLNKTERPFLVAQAVQLDNPNYFDINFVAPEAFIKKKVKKFYHLHSTYKVDMMLTEDHDCVARFNVNKYPKDRYTKRYEGAAPAPTFYQDLKPADIKKVLDKTKGKTNLTDGRICVMPIPYSGGEVVGYPLKPDPELNSLTAPEMRVQVAVIADGYFPNKNDNKCELDFTKERKVERFEKLCKKAGIPFVKKIVSPMNNKKRTRFTIIAPVRCKEFDHRFYTLDEDLKRAIFDEVWLWDGHTEHVNNLSAVTIKRFYTSLKSSADYVQYLCNINGFYAGIGSNFRDKTGKIPYIVTYTQNAQIINQNSDDGKINTAWATIKNCDVIEYDTPQNAYCFRVQSGMLFLRRNNKTFITGNSGKTKVMIDNMAALVDKDLITGSVVLAPKGVYRNWAEKEIPTHLRDDIDREVLVWKAEATDKYKKELAKKIDEWDGKTLQIFVYNIESLTSDKGVKLLDKFIKKHGGNVMGIVDESTCIKNHKAKRTKAAIKIGQACKVRRIATGSPITNSPLDLYSQCEFMDKGVLGHGSFYSFRNTYAIVEKKQTRMGSYYDHIKAYKNLDHLSSRIEPYSFRITKKECLDLPDKIYTVRHVELTKEQLVAYKEMYDREVAFFGDESMTVEIALTKMLRLHQILCGCFTTDDGEVLSIPNNRVDELLECINETSGKIIIWANYVQNIRDIESRLKSEYGDDSVVTYYGGTTNDERSEAIRLFQDPDSPVRFFVSNPVVGGRGITLTEAHTVIYYSNNFSLETRQQSEDRAHRIGQKNNVTYIDLVVPKSMDEKVINALLNKRNIANEILKDELEAWITL